MESLSIEQINNLQGRNAKLQCENEKLRQELEMRKANEQESKEFWDGVFDEDFPFNKENAYKELSDYYFLLQQIPEIYCEITGGTLSKTNYFASSVIAAYRDNCERCQEKQEQELEKLKKQFAEPPYIRKAKFLRELLAKMTKLKTALKGIEEIAKQYLTDCQGSKCDAMDEIIQKINEVLNEVEHN